MHRYRDAIVYLDSTTQEYERSMYGAYVLFPYPNEELYRADEISELRLDDEEQLKLWREKRRSGKVKVVLDHEYIDLAKKVRVEEVPENK